MRNLGYTVQCSFSAFETQVEEITSYISQKIIQVIEFNQSILCSLNLSFQNNVVVLYKFFICLYCSWNKLHVYQMESLDDDDLSSFYGTPQRRKLGQLKVSMINLM